MAAFGDCVAGGSPYLRSFIHTNGVDSLLVKSYMSSMPSPLARKTEDWNYILLSIYLRTM